MRAHIGVPWPLHWEAGLPNDQRRAIRAVSWRISMKLLRWFSPLAALLWSASAPAAFVQYSSPIAAQAIPFSSAFTVQKFDSNLGSLTGISLTLSSNITARIDVWSNLAAPASFSNAFATFAVTVTAQSPDTTSVSATPSASLASGVALPSMPGSYINTFAGLTASASNTTAVVPANWAYYVGLGGGAATFTASAGNGSYGGTSPFGLFFSGSGLADGIFSVRYDYALPTAVPLPGSLGMLAAALGLTGLYVRRTSSRAAKSPSPG
jgi:hypothetical protein